MPSLYHRSATADRQYSGQSGFGTRAYCQRFGHKGTKGAANKFTSIGVPLIGVRNFQLLGMVTNPVVGSHMESIGGFVQSYPGLKDAGSVEFDANFVPDVAEWQRFETGEADANAFINGLFDNRPLTPTNATFATEKYRFLWGLYDLYVTFPNSFDIFHFHGYPAGIGPCVMAQESIIISNFSFKISGQPHLLRPTATPTFVVKSGLTLPAAATDKMQMVRFHEPGVYEMFTFPYKGSNAHTLLDGAEDSLQKDHLSRGAFVITYDMPYLD